MKLLYLGLFEAEARLALRDAGCRCSQTPKTPKCVPLDITMSAAPTATLQKAHHHHRASLGGHHYRAIKLPPLNILNQAAQMRSFRSRAYGPGRGGVIQHVGESRAWIGSNQSQPFFSFSFFPSPDPALKLESLVLYHFLPLVGTLHFALHALALALGPFFSLCLSLGESEKHQELLLSSLLA